VVEICAYRNYDDTPSCIVGTALSYIHPDVRLTEHLHCAVERGFSIEDCILNDIATPEAAWYARAAQYAQDNGHTWGHALAAAEAWLAEQESDNETV